MTVEEVHIGARVNELDPAKAKEKNEKDPGYWQRQAAEARSKREYLEEQKMQERISGEPPPPPESPISIKGAINLGDFDLQAQAKENAALMKQAATEAAAREERLTKERDDAKSALYTAQLNHLTENFNSKLNDLQGMVRQGMNQKSFMEQYKELTEMANQLGLHQPVNNGNPDLTSRLEIMKLEHQMKLDDRNFQREQKKDERAWQLELKKLEQQSRDAEARLNAEKEKNAMFAALPQIIGGAAGKAIADSGKTGGIASAAPKTSSSGQSFTAEAPFNEAGELPCPNCGEIVGIGPTATKAMCAGCGAKVSIKRTTIEPETESETPVTSDHGLGRLS